MKDIERMRESGININHSWMVLSSFLILFFIWFISTRTVFLDWFYFKLFLFGVCFFLGEIPGLTDFFIPFLLFFTPGFIERLGLVLDLLKEWLIRGEKVHYFKSLTIISSFPLIVFSIFTLILVLFKEILEKSYYI